MAYMARKYLTTEKVAEELSTEAAAVRRWIRQGRLQAIDIGAGARHIYRVDEAELVRFIEARVA